MTPTLTCLSGKKTIRELDIVRVGFTQDNPDDKNRYTLSITPECYVNKYVSYTKIRVLKHIILLSVLLMFIKVHTELCLV